MRGLNPKTHAALIKLDAMIKQKGILAATLFRDRTYNTSVGAQGNVASHDEAADRYVVALDLKKIVEENGLKEGRSEARKAIKKVFEERYHNQSSAKKEKKATGVSYFYKKMAF